MDTPVFECNVTVKDTEYRFRVFYDESPENPREWDNLGTIVTFRSHWTRNNGSPCGDQEEYAFDFEEEIKNGDRVPALWYPLWASSCGLSMGEQSEKDDSIVGYIFAERTLLLKEYSAKILSKEVKEKVKQVFKGELETYNLYYNGEVYVYILETVCPLNQGYTCVVGTLSRYERKGTLSAVFRLLSQPYRSL